MNPDLLAIPDIESGLCPNEIVCPFHNTAYHRPLGECPDCKDDRS